MITAKKNDNNNNNYNKGRDTNVDIAQCGICIDERIDRIFGPPKHQIQSNICL